MAKELKLTKKDRISVWWRSTFLQGSWNYERMQNGGWAFAMIPAIKRLYKTKEERAAALKRHLDIDLLDNIIRALSRGETLPVQNKDHELTGDWAGHRECHIQPDWLLVYRIEDDVLVLTLSRTGSHSDLFGK